MPDNGGTPTQAKARVLKSAAGLLRRTGAGPVPINLALQGGGAHGAFTWGALDRLLDCRAVSIAAISGTSAGAVNAVALAAGFLEDGASGARAKLETIWRAVSELHSFRPTPSGLDDPATDAPAPNRGPVRLFLRAVSGSFSPYQFNPLDVDPLRKLLQENIDFEGLRRHPPMALFVNATEAATGRGRIFTGDEISLEAVLASACLPSLRHAVKIGREHYWDGGFSANPPLLPLIEAGHAGDTLLIKLTAAAPKEPPKRLGDIEGHVTRLMFSQPLMKEVELIEMARRVSSSGFGFSDRLARRLNHHRFHMVDGGRYTAELSNDSKLTPDWPILTYLYHRGAGAMAYWIRRHAKSAGRRATVDLAETFL